jgi:hypothetical protein
MRSKERFTQTPSSRSASRRERRVGLDEAEHRRERRRDHPGALGLGGQAHGARRQRDVQRRGLGELVGRADRLAERVVAVGRQLAARGEDALDDLVDVERDADHAGGGDRHLVLADPRPPSRRALHPRGILEPAPARSAALALPALAADDADRVRAGTRSWVSSTGAASTPERVKRAALVVSGASETSSPRSGRRTA